jgi:DNA invertase Pin-like site-specific DNA recombinase
MNAVIYARYSSHGQTEQSIEGQLRDCHEFARHEEISIVGEYIDRAIPGKTDDRPDFQRMIADARKRQFDYVIVWKLDRFARNRYDSAIYKHKLKQNGVKVLSAMENIGDGNESIILEAVLEASAEYYSRDLSKKVKRGQRETALKGGFLGGMVPIGYKVIDKIVVIDEEKAPAILYAFEQYAAGVSKRQIMNALTAKGLKGVTGKPLSLTSFQHALKNPKYTGEYDFNGIAMDNFPALVSKELFERVQARLQERAHAPASSKGSARMEYLLQGKAYCGSCGSRMVGESGRGKGGAKFYYYACGQKKKLHTCAKVNEKKDFIEWYVVEQTIEYVLTPARIELIADAVVAEYDKEFNDDVLKALERRIAKIDRDIDAAVDLMIQNANREIRARTEKRVEELTAQKEDLSIDLAKLQIANGIRYTKDDILAWLRQFCKGDLMDLEFRRRIIDVFINSVYLYDDKIAIFYNIKGGKQISYMEVADALDGDEFDGADGSGSGVRISSLTPRHIKTTGLIHSNR